MIISFCAVSQPITVDNLLKETSGTVISPITSRWVIVMNNYLSKIASYGLDSGKYSKKKSVLLL
jgi:hypothetical protein